ncbi:hypothetical protein [Halochromatium roseum]|uniref:hypothetical protein n=1 Tax=Halochromatium roseum TaxID=391920 RepID=UPI001911DB85|nr:hypothetical protein [Halochromatium roseum]MBK5939393.1 hypothetical protein [Halochromatium roseum]
MSLLRLYSFFHLNLAYSAIEEDRPHVIERCYWSLLRLARQRALPFGIELSGYTLETTISAGIWSSRRRGARR